jgi:uncharacterized protein (DUF2141 family)
MQVSRISYLVASFMLALPAVKAADLSIDVAGIQSTKGHVLIAVYDRADSFLQKPAAVAKVDAAVGKVTAVLTKLPAGDYAISAFQDLNDNGNLDSNLLGIPTEPYGFSNDAEGHFGPPSFEQSRVHLAEEGSHITVNLR